MLTVVLATADGGRLDLALSALDAACAGVPARILLVTAGAVETEPLASIQAGDAKIEVIRCPAQSLVPDLWGAGLRAATGEAVAFTSTACAVSPTWARALLATLQSGADGVGGPFELADGSSAVESAMFYLRYARFLGGPQAARLRGGEIAGDNAAYRLSALEHYDATDGFWEVAFHKSLRAAGGSLAWCPAAVARFASRMTFAQALTQRFVHGRHSGAFRLAGGRARWKILLAAPLVPVVLAWRAFRDTAPSTDHRSRFLGALPVFLALAAAWAAGEFVGGVLGGAKDA